MGRALVEGLSAHWSVQASSALALSHMQGLKACMLSARFYLLACYVSHRNEGHAPTGALTYLHHAVRPGTADWQQFGHGS